MLKFLLIDNDHDGLLYFGRTIRRKFPQADLVECGSGEEAVRLMEDAELSAVVCHRADIRSEKLIPRLRQRRPELPIVWVSSAEPKVAARDIGADRFLPYAEWLMVGTVIGELIGAAPGPRAAADAAYRISPDG